MARKIRNNDIQSLYRSIEEQPLIVSLRLRTIISFRQHLEELQTLFRGLDSFKEIEEWFQELHGHINEYEKIVARCARDDNFGENGIEEQLFEYVREVQGRSCHFSFIGTKDREFDKFQHDVYVLFENMFDGLIESFMRFGHIMSGSRDEGDLNLHKPFSTGAQRDCHDIAYENESLNASNSEIRLTRINILDEKKTLRCLGDIAATDQ